MKNFKSWKGDLEEILPLLRRVALGDAVVRVFPLNDRVALGLPCDGDLAQEVVRLYRPMKWKARLFAKLLEGGARLGLIRFFKSKKIEVKEPEISWLKGLSELGFLGCNPGHGIRCVILNRGENGALKVSKVAIGGTLNPVIKEAEKLRELSVKIEEWWPLERPSEGLTGPLFGPIMLRGMVRSRWLERALYLS